MGLSGALLGPSRVVSRRPMTGYGTSVMCAVARTSSDQNAGSRAVGVQWACVDMGGLRSLGRDRAVSRVENGVELGGVPDPADLGGVAVFAGFRRRRRRRFRQRRW